MLVPSRIADTRRDCTGLPSISSAMSRVMMNEPCECAMIATGAAAVVVLQVVVPRLEHVVVLRAALEHQLAAGHRGAKPVQSSPGDRAARTDGTAKRSARTAGGRRCALRCPRSCRCWSTGPSTPSGRRRNSRSAPSDSPPTSLSSSSRWRRSPSSSNRSRRRRRCGPAGRARSRACCSQSCRRRLARRGRGAAGRLRRTPGSVRTVRRRAGMQREVYAAQVLLVDQERAAALYRHTEQVARSFRPWKLGVGLTMLVVASLAASAAAPGVLAGALLHPARRTVNRQAPVGCTDATFDGDGVQLRGWRCGATTARRGTVILSARHCRYARVGRRVSPPFFRTEAST